ncbi:hypothetical protein BDV40DRAFT_261217 [Aspergillus tamarii]|uniref:Uncharacterized protein n=1 Tax=Aspergillus tamarii TaxID=41984 RepID=A0A5N6V0J9_ASPTM|nr:hypothetical protein BDV40DRAFT_261217 [Aspergillus tamarii]
MSTCPIPFQTTVQCFNFSGAAQIRSRRSLPFRLHHFYGIFAPLIVIQLVLNFTYSSL